MKICWTVEKNDVGEGFLMRNPAFFEKPITDADETVIFGDYPHIVEAYKDAGLDISAKGKPKAKKFEPTSQEKPETLPVKPSGDLVDIPSDWETLAFMSKRSLARKIAGSDKINKGDEVNDVIRAELEKRGA